MTSSDAIDLLACTLRCRFMLEQALVLWENVFCVLVGSIWQIKRPLFHKLMHNLFV